MLSYKLRHFCSFVIASLSLLGLSVVSQRAMAAPPSGGSVTCSMTTSAGESVNATAVAQTSACYYTCNDGYAYVDSSGKASSFTVSGSGTIVPGLGCVSVKPTCVISSSHTGIVAAEPVLAGDPTGLAPYVCQWTCKDGYSSAGGTNATTVFKSSETGGAGDTITSSQDCKARSYTLTLDCGAGGSFITGSSVTFNGAGKQTGVLTAYYMQKVDIPSDAVCEKTGHEFLGYNKTFQK